MYYLQLSRVRDMYCIALTSLFETSRSLLSRTMKIRSSSVQQYSQRIWTVDSRLFLFPILYLSSPQPTILISLYPLVATSASQHQLHHASPLQHPGYHVSIPRKHIRPSTHRPPRHLHPCPTTNFVDNGGVCFTDMACKSSFCKDRRCANNHCTSNQDCDSQTICSHGSTCIIGCLPDDHECERNEQCRSGNCNDRQCAAGTRYPGAECSDNREFPQGLICWNMEFIAQDRKKCLKPDEPGTKGRLGNPCSGNEDCGKELECKDERQGVEKIQDIFKAFPPGAPENHLVCVEKKAKCTPFQSQCFMDSDCCSNKCRTTEIFFFFFCTSMKRNGLVGQALSGTE